MGISPKRQALVGFAGREKPHLRAAQRFSVCVRTRISTVDQSPALLAASGVRLQPTAPAVGTVKTRTEQPLTPYENPNPDVILNGRSPRRISRVKRKLSARSPRHRSEEFRVAQRFSAAINRLSNE
jgi:hypothetical protein